MKKFGKFLLPPAFSIGTVVTCLLFELGLTFAPIDGYAALTIFFIFVFIWALLVLPFFCVKYTKIIVEEKYSFVFCIYNCILISLAPLFCVSIDLFKSIFAFVFLWVAFCTFVPLLLRLSSKRRGEDPTTGEKPSASDFLLQNKTKNILAFCFICFYTLTCLPSFLGVSFLNLYLYLLYDILPLISLVLVLVFILLKNKNYILKDLMLPIALALEIPCRVFAAVSSVQNLSTMIKFDPLDPVYTALSCATALAVIFMFVGTLFNFKYLTLLKIGALGHIVVSGVGIVFSFVCVLLVENHIPHISVLGSLARILFLVGIYLLATNKRAEQPA